MININGYISNDYFEMFAIRVAKRYTKLDYIKIEFIPNYLILLNVKNRFWIVVVGRGARAL